MVILAAVDGESIPDRVVEVGADLAADHGEGLVVLHVMPQERFDARQEATSADSGPLGPSLAPSVSYDGGGSGGGPSASRNVYDLEDGQRDAERVARNVVKETLGERENVAFAGRVGEPVEEIIAAADRRDARYIVIGGRKRTPVGKAVFGSATQSILLTAERPVMTIMDAE